MPFRHSLNARLALTPRAPGTCLWDSFVPDSLRRDEDLLRRARLQVRFGWLGAIFGTAYAAFYSIIGHWAGAGIIVLCSLLFACLPGLLKRRGRLELTGNLYAAVLLAGFTALCAVEGGIRGHAIAWLASVPLCVLLLVPFRSAVWWGLGCFVIALAFGILEMSGVTFPKTYPARWGSLLDTAGYAGLVSFMALLGIVFERTRARAFLGLKAALDDLSVANYRLSRLNEEKDEFMKIAAHDLKNPLCGISGHAELLTLLGPPTEEQVNEASEIICSLSKRMLDIITNLLDVRKIEEGSMEMKVEPCRADDLLARIVSDQTPRAGKKRIRLVIPPSAALPEVLADAGAVQQILDNLLSNAIKYSPPDTTVRCLHRQDARGVYLEIADEGPGLSAEDQKNLFQKFARLSPRPTAGEDSHGLGLWIVQRMARSMGGEVSCISESGKGSRFILFLPFPAAATEGNRGSTCPALQPVAG